jgi:hypothetical protein
MAVNTGLNAIRHERESVRANPVAECVKVAGFER